MQLKSFGCSFIYGTELADCSDSASQCTWPALLAQNLNYDYECYARGGSGNLRILEQVLSQVGVSNSFDLFVIGWTWIDRFDYYSGTPGQWWKTIRPGNTDAVSLNYYKDIHSEYIDKFTSLCHIKLAIDTLQQHNIPFIMTYMDSLLFDQRWHISPSVSELQTRIQPFMSDFEGLSFLEWSRHHGYSETAAWHPLEDAHRAAADYMIKVFDKQNTVAR